MREKRRVPIIAVIVFFAIMTFLHFWINPMCLDTCDDGNPCTSDYCSKDTGYSCAHSPINGPQAGCYGELICGIRTCNNGICSINYYPDCCGNEKCEAGEDYVNCLEDCPDCDDENECTNDHYDYDLQRCVNNIITPCCGNGICDKGAETSFNCPKDCPDCDDKNELTVDSFNYVVQECENILAYYFIDDFEGDLKYWNFTDSSGQPTLKGWGVKLEKGNRFLRGIGHNWANLDLGPWEDYALELKFKIVSGSINFNYRINSEDTISRYMVWIDYDHVRLAKNVGETYYNNLVSKDILLGNDDWHKLEIRGYKHIINVYIDNNLMFEYKDTSNPILSGKVAFETLYHSPEFLIDDVKIKPIMEGGVSSKFESLFLDTYNKD